MERPVRNEQDEEQEVIRKVLAGAKEEYRHLVAANQSQIYAMMLKQVGDPTVAEELTQDAFVRAYRHLNKFRFDARFSTWLTRIALNLSHSYFASRRFKEQQRSTSLDMSTYERNHQQNSSDSEQDSPYDPEAIQQLRRAIQQLKPKFREVLVLCGLEKKSYQEAADLLGIRVGTVRSRLSRARHQLQQLYFEV